MFGNDTLKDEVRSLRNEVASLKKEHLWLAFTTNNPFKYKEGEIVCILRYGEYNKCTVLKCEYNRYDNGAFMGYPPFDRERHHKSYVVRVVENQIPGYIGEQLIFEEKDLLPLSAFKAICTKTQDNESKRKPKK